MKSIRPDAVAIYIRWSTEEQTEGTTLETQRERCSLYVQSQGWQVNPDLIFVDEGFSGGSLDRPAMTRLRQQIQAGLIDCVVTYAMDRLSRSVADTVQLVQEEWLSKCIYRSASQPISTDDGNPTGQLIFNILASFAEFERALIRERTHSGLVRRVKDGKYPGTKVPPFGYCRDGPGHLVIDSISSAGTLQGPAAVVKRIFELAVEGPLGQGPVNISRVLAADGISSPAGGPWWHHQVRTILQNPVYCGDLVYGRRRVNPAHRRDKNAPQRLYGQEPLVRVDGATPPIVARELFERVQKLFESRARSSTRKNLQARNRSLLSSIARCKCGGPLSIFYDRYKRRYYRCSRNFQSSGGCPARPGVLSAEEMEQAVVAAVKERYGTPELRAAALTEASVARVSTDRLEVLDRAVAKVENGLKGIEEDLSRLRRSARRGEIDLATYQELRTDADAERAELQERLMELQTEREGAKSLYRSVAEWEVVMERVDLWEELEVSAQRDVLYGLLRQVVIFKPKGEDRGAEINIEWEAP